MAKKTTEEVKKEEEVKKNENAIEVVTATPTAPAVKSTSVMVPTLKEVELLEGVFATKLDALAALMDDVTLPEPYRLKVKALVEQTNPQKPGMDEVTTSWALPRLMIVQPTTQQAAKADTALPGALFTSSGQTLERPFAFIPLFFHQENIKFPEGQTKGPPDCSSPDAKLGSPRGLCLSCPDLPFGKQNGGRGDQQQTGCQNQIVVAMLSVDLTQVYLMSFSKTSHKAGNALVALAKAHPFPWKQSYLLSTEKKTGDKGTYYIAQIAPTGKNNSEEAIRVAKALHEVYDANRKRSLADYYLRAASAPQSAAAAEGNFQPSRLDGGLGEGADPDLSEPPPPTSTVRNSSKPM